MIFLKITYLGHDYGSKLEIIDTDQIKSNDYVINNLDLNAKYYTLQDVSVLDVAAEIISK